MNAVRTEVTALAYPVCSPIHVPTTKANSLYSDLVGGLPFVARVVLLACVGGLAFVVYAFGGFLL